MAIANVPGGDLYEELGDGFPILLIHPAKATASTCGSVPEELAQAARVVVYEPAGVQPLPGRVNGSPRITPSCAMPDGG